MVLQNRAGIKKGKIFITKWSRCYKIVQYRRPMRNTICLVTEILLLVIPEKLKFC